MLSYISKKLAVELEANEVIQRDDLEIYEYGILLILMASFTSICILSTGFIIHKAFFTIIFLGALIHLRHYSGGYHACSFSLCFCISCFSYGVGLFILWLHNFTSMSLPLILASLMSSYYLCKNGAMNSKKNPKTEKEMAERSKRVRFITICYSLVGIVFFSVMKQYTEVAVALISTQIIAVISIVAVKTKEESL